MADIDVVIVGAGVVGLALGASLARFGKSVIVLEKNEHFGEETSSRNSEVIHAGLYYPTGSLKAKLCVRGNQMIYDYCSKRAIMANPLGKLILATSSSEIKPLEALYQRGLDNGVPDLELIDVGRIKTLEPQAHAIAGIFAPSSGIMDSHAIMLALLGEIEDGGGALARSSPFLGAQRKDGAWHIDVGGLEPTHITATTLILSAGLWSSHVAKSVEGLAAEFIPDVKFAKGNYFKYQGKVPFSHLIYPMPSIGGLGIHLTPDAHGQARFGPDVQAVDTLDYRVDETRKADFVASIRRYWPAVQPDLLTPDYTGIRPKIGDALHSFEDFQILSQDAHGLENLICLFGIDSPGLTSSLAIADEVIERLNR